MHESVMEWTGHIVDMFQLDDPLIDVLEIGSLNVNGSVRDHFKNVETYIGIDMEAGPGVDIIASSHNIPIADEDIDLIMCCEMLEHDSDPTATFREIGRVLRPAGAVILTARAGDFPFHHPPDYWRFTHDDIHCLAFVAGLDVTFVGDDPMPTHPGVFALLSKPQALSRVAP